MTTPATNNNFDSDTNTVSLLRDLLNSPYDVLRCDAVQALGFLPGDVSIEAITKALRDEDEDVRCDAVSALGLIADTRAIPALIENLKYDPCGDVKVLAIDLLGRLGAKEASPLLRDLVISRTASNEIEWNEDDFFEDGWDDWVDMQSKSIKALGDFRDEASIDLIVNAMLDEEGQDLSAVGCTALANMGDLGLRALEGLIPKASDRLKRAIVSAISTASGESAINFLHELITSPDPQLRLAALINLSAHKGQIQYLKSLLEDQDPVVRANAFRLTEPTEQQIVDVLLLGAPEPVMLAALSGLERGELLDAEHPYIKLLIVLVDNKSQDIAAAAITALATRGGKNIISEFETRIIDPETPSAVAWAIVQALGNLSSKRGIRILAQSAFSESREVRLEALSSLQRRVVGGSKTATHILCNLAMNNTVEIDALEEPLQEDKNADVRREMSRSGLKVEKADDHGHVSTLGAILGDEEIANKWVEANANSKNVEPLTDHEMALLAMAERMPKKQKISLEQSQESAAADSRRVAVRLLASCSGEGVRETLINALDVQDEELCRSAADGLLQRIQKGEHLTETELEKISHLMFSANTDLRRLGLQILASQGEQHVEPYLEKSLQDADHLVRSAAVKIGSRGILPYERLCLLLDDPMPLVRSAAASGIAQSNCDDAIDVLFEFVFNHGGFHCVEMSKTLFGLSPTKVVDMALKVLATEKRKSDWAIAMEFLKLSLQQRSMN